jgi:hypothetical protein
VRVGAEAEESRAEKSRAEKSRAEKSRAGGTTSCWEKKRLYP